MLAHPSSKLSNTELDKKTCVTLCCNIKPNATDSSWLMSLSKAQAQEVTDVACLHFTVHFFSFLKVPNYTNVIYHEERCSYVETKQ